MSPVNEKEAKTISKFISLVLRHKPETIGLTLDSNGWAVVDDLIRLMNTSGTPLTAEILDHIVQTNSKKRFAFDETKTKIRASQGHSVDIDLNLGYSTPPQYLYHGTAEKNVDSILKTGIIKGTRQHVHLSIDLATALSVGQRHGKPIVLIIDAGQMHTDGFSFFLSENNVWLTDHIPAKYLSLPGN